MARSWDGRAWPPGSSSPRSRSRSRPSGARPPLRFRRCSPCPRTRSRWGPARPPEELRARRARRRPRPSRRRPTRSAPASASRAARRAPRRSSTTRRSWPRRSGSRVRSGRMFDFAYTTADADPPLLRVHALPRRLPGVARRHPRAVAKAGVPVQVVFVTVDPARDTPRGARRVPRRTSGRAGSASPGRRARSIGRPTSTARDTRSSTTGSANGLRGRAHDGHLPHRQEWELDRDVPVRVDSQQIVDELRAIAGA